MKVYVVCEVDSTPEAAFTKWQDAYDYWYDRHRPFMTQPWWTNERTAALSDDIVELDLMEQYKSTPEAT